MYSYQKTEPGQWSVGLFTEGGQWQTESVWYTPEEAAERAHWLNRGTAPTMEDIKSSLNGQNKK
jgi:hypothetical protein